MFLMRACGSKVNPSSKANKMNHDERGTWTFATFIHRLSTGCSQTYPQVELPQLRLRSTVEDAPRNRGGGRKERLRDCNHGSRSITQWTGGGPPNE